MKEGKNKGSYREVYRKWGKYKVKEFTFFFSENEVLNFIFIDFLYF